MTITLAGQDYVLDLLTQASGAYQSYFIALGTGAEPSRTMTGETFEEPNENDYARAVYPNQSGYWTASDTKVTNVLDVLFPITTSEWGRVKHWAIATEPVGGLLLWIGTFKTSFDVGIANQVRIPPGGLSLATTTVAPMVPL